MKFRNRNSRVQTSFGVAIVHLALLLGPLFVNNNSSFVELSSILPDYSGKSVDFLTESWGDSVDFNTRNLIDQPLYSTRDTGFSGVIAFNRDIDQNRDIELDGNFAGFNATFYASQLREYILVADGTSFGTNEDDVRLDLDEDQFDTDVYTDAGVVTDSEETKLRLSFAQAETFDVANTSSIYVYNLGQSSSFTFTSNKGVMAQNISIPSGTGQFVNLGSNNTGVSYVDITSDSHVHVHVSSFDVANVMVGGAPSLVVDNTEVIFREGEGAIQIAASARVSDTGGNAEWNRGTLSVQITTGSNAADGLSILDTNDDGIQVAVSGTNVMSGDTEIGEVSVSDGIASGSELLTITFNANATNQSVQRVLESILFDNTSELTENSYREITVIATDATGNRISDFGVVYVATRFYDCLMSSPRCEAYFPQTPQAVDGQLIEMNQYTEDDFTLEELYPSLTLASVPGTYLRVEQYAGYVLINGSPVIKGANDVLDLSGTISITPDDDGDYNILYGTLVFPGVFNQLSRLYVSVNFVNLEPTFTVSGNQTVRQDAGPQIINDFISSFDDGDLQKEQEVVFNIEDVTDTDLFSEQPVISNMGALSFSPNPNKFGKATISVSMSDNGGTANGGDDTSDIQEFDIFITPKSISINEAHPKASSELEFVEIYDGGVGSTALDGLVLVLFNGSNDLTYKDVALTGATNADGFYVIGDTDVPNLNLDWGSTSFQNGTDAVALYVGSASDFSASSPPTTDGLVDVIVYGSTDDTDLRAALGNPGLEDSGDEFNSISRSQDGTGVFVLQPDSPSVTNEIIPPTVTGITLPEDGFYTANSNLEFIIATDKVVLVSGEPSLEITIGEAQYQALYVGGSGTNQLTFSYSVQINDLDTDGITVGVLKENEGTLADVDGNLLITDLSGLSLFNEIVVDAEIPYVFSFERRMPLVQETNANPIMFSATFNEPVVGVDPTDFMVNFFEGATISVVEETTTIYRVVVSGENLSTHNGSVGLDLADGATITDEAGNSLSPKEPETDETFTLDNIAPTLSVSTNNETTPQSGAFTATFTFSEDISGFTIEDVSVGNGEPSDFTISNASVYTALITPSADGEVTVDVVASVAQDLAGNDNTAAAQLSATNDETGPTVAIASNASTPQSGAFTATFEFDETVVGFTLEDITVVNGEPSDFTTTSASVYIVLITPKADGEVTVDVVANVAQDLAGNDNTAATQLNMTNDETAPVITITSDASTPQSGAFTATFTFSEDVTGFTLADITVGNGDASELTTTSASIYTALITPSADGEVTVDVVASVAQDLAGNDNTAAAQLSATNDETGPTVAIASNASTPQSGAFTATFEFDETVVGLTIEDISVVNGEPSEFTTTSTSVYTVLITPSADGEVIIDVAAGVAQDLAGNDNTAAAQLNVVNDETVPTITITSDATSVQSGSFTTTFTFSEDISGFTIEDITVVNGEPSEFTTTSTSVYTVLITPSADGEVIIDVAAGVAQDLVGNDNTAAAQLNVVNDETAPTITVTSDATSVQSGSFTTTFTFSEDISGFTIEDITVVNGEPSEFTTTSTSVYTALITPSADGEVTIDIASSVAQDLAGNDNTAAAQLNVVNDETAPTITITSDATSVQSGAFTTTFTYSEDISGFTIEEISVGNGDASDFTTTSASVYTVLITPKADGEVTIDVAAGVAQDLAGNDNMAATQLNVVNDETAPTITITSDATSVQSGAFTTTFTFSEDISGFTIEDISVVNGEPSEFTTSSARVYSALISPSADGEVAVDVAANVAQDLAGNDNMAATQLNVVNDETAPTITITSDATSVQSGAFTTTLTFSEDISGFTIEDISVGNGDASDFTTTSASVYTVLITPKADGEVTIDVAEGVAQDGVGFDNSAAKQFSVINDATAPSSPVVLSITDDTGANGSDQKTNDQTLSFNGNAEANATVEVVLDGTSLGTIQADGLGQWSFNHETITLSDASYGITAKATDAAGNTSAESSALAVTIDTEAPAAPTLDLDVAFDTGVSNSDDLTNATSLKFNGTAEANADVEVFINDVSFGVVGTGVNGAWTLTTSPLTLTGELAVKAFTTDQVGNTGVASDALSVTIDTQIALPVLSPADNSTGVLPSDNLVLTFSEAIIKGGNDISIRRSSDDSILESFDVSSSKVTVSGSEVTIDLDNALPPATEFYITIGLGAFVDAAGNDFIGISNTTDWSFTSIAASTVSSVTVPVADTYGIGAELDFATNMILPVSITGTATIPVTIGGTTVNATQVGSVSNSNTIIFRYTVLEDELDADGISIGSLINLNGGTMKDAFGVDAILTLSNVASSTGVLVDGVRPVPTITTAGTSVTNTAFITTFEFNKTVSGFTLEDITVSNGTADNLTEVIVGRQWTAEITPIADGAVSVNLASGVAVDSPGNSSAAGNTVSKTFDGTVPSVLSITRKDEDQLNTTTSSAAFRVVFSEDVTGVDLTDFDVSLTGTTGAVNSVIQVTADTYDVIVNDISGEGTVSLNLTDDDSILDIATNPLGGTGEDNGDFILGEFYTTNFLPSDITLRGNISENNTIGDIVGTLSSTDPDTEDSHTYTIVSGEGGTDNTSFTINGADLKAAEVFDFETKSSYSIRVRSTDGNGGAFEKSLTVTIGNVLEPSIFVTGDATFDVSALGLSQQRVLSIENDGDVIVELSITAPDGFSVSASSLSLAVGAISDLVVTFVPTEVKTYNENIIFDFEGENVLHPVSGEGAIITSIENGIIAISDIEIFPNPTDQLLTIDLSKLNRQELDIEIVNSTGIRIFNRPSYAEQILRLDVSSYESGIYIVQFTNGKSVVRKKIIIKR